MFSTEKTNRRYRICIVYHFLPDYRSGVFKELLSSNSIDVEFIAGSPGGALSTIREADNIPYHRVKNFWIKRLLWQSGVIKKLISEDYDLVIFRGSWLTVSTWIAAPIMRLKKTPVLFWLRGWNKPVTGLVRYFRLFYLRLANALLLYGNRGEYICKMFGYPADRLYVVGNSIPLPIRYFNEIKQPDEEIPTVLWVSRILKYKMPELLIDAVKLAHTKGVEMKCVFVGPGDPSHLIEKSSSLGLEDYIQFTGKLYGRDVEAWCDKASVIAIPNWAGLTVATGITNGVPVVVNDDPGANPPEWEYVNPINRKKDSLIPVNGSYFEKNDSSSLAEELIRWCSDARATEDHRQEIAKQGRWLVSPKRSSEAILSAVETVLEKR